jgi:hypothetical protein
VWRLQVPSQAHFFGWPDFMVRQITHGGHTSVEWNWPALMFDVVTAFIVVAIAAFAGNRIGSAIDEVRDRRGARDNLCATCRYNLTGNTTGRCPECGSKVEKDSRPPA